MTALRVLATLVLLVAGWLCRRRPLLILLVAAGVRRVWRDTRGYATADRAYQALTYRSVRLHTGRPAGRRARIGHHPAVILASHRR